VRNNSHWRIALGPWREADHKRGHCDLSGGWGRRPAPAAAPHWRSRSRSRQAGRATERESRGHGARLRSG
jgi:hypothetical protein